MSLKQNGRLVQQLPLRFRGGATLSFEYQETNKSQSRNMFAGEGGIDPKNGLPSGHLPPSSWMIPQKSGAISAFISIIGVGSLIATGTLGLPTSSTINGTSTFTGAGKLVVQGLASISSDGQITGQLVAPVDGSSNISSVGVISGTVLANGFAISSIMGSSTFSATPFATGVIEAEISPFTELSPQNLADAVWDALKTDYNNTDSMGLLVQEISEELDKRLKKTEFIALK